jgi:peptide-methionine (S)-S-oxide reductase
MKTNSSIGKFAVIALLLCVGALSAWNLASAKVVPLPDPTVDDTLVPQPGQQVAVIAGGCFWGIQLVFEHVKGVVKVTAGYSGGAANTAQYQIVSTGRTGHAESVRIVYDPSKITYGQLLKVFFAVAHNPTELNEQGPDEGTQYRSAIFYADANQQRIANAYITQLDEAKAFRHKIVTQVVPLVAFYQAEGYHQDYAVHNPYNQYIVVNDLPKLDELKKRLPDLYVKNP